MRFARLAFALFTSIWLVLLLTAPVAALGAPASALVYAFGSLICHQRPERSFHIDAAQLPVCARCFGIYAGAALAGLLMLMPWELSSIAGLKPCATWWSSVAGLKPRATWWAVWRSPLGLRHSVIVAAVPTAITWGAEVIGIWSPSNITRFAAAVPLGAAVAVTVNYLECARPPRTGLNPPRMPI